MQVGPYYEAWFQLHLRTILSGSGNLSSSKQWDQALKIARNQSKLACDYEYLVAKFVTDELYGEAV
jgi:hypothetical protein